MCFLLYDNETTIYSVKVNFNGPNVDHMSAILKTVCHHLNRGNRIAFQFFHVSVKISTC
jgi:hypothetical protein